jgi:hypothetical protein
VAIATFPNYVRTFSPKVDLTDYILADHVNAIQKEIVAIESSLGATTAGSSFLRSTYGSVSVVQVNTLGTISGGSGYVSGTYSNITLTLSSGTSPFIFPTATIVVSGGAVTSVTLTTYGAGVDTTTVLTAPASSIGGTGSGFLAPVASTTSTTSSTFVRQTAWSSLGDRLRNIEIGLINGVPGSPYVMIKGGSAIQPTSGTIGVTLKTVAGTANLLEARPSAGTPLNFNIDYNGLPKVGAANVLYVGSSDYLALQASITTAATTFHPFFLGGM